MFGRFNFGARALRAAIIVVVVARIGVAGHASADPAEAKKIFTTRCTACHTFGKGVKVGPDLKGVTERRQRPWLLKFVRSSSTVIASGDATAVELFGQFNQMRMPDWVDLTEDQVNSIMDWLATNGPDQQDIDARLAESATLAEIESGRQLFHGERPFVNGGTACVSCHSIRDGGHTVGGSLAADLTDMFSIYQDGAVTQFLKHPCFRRLPESTSASFLSREEQFYIKGYLRQAVLADRSDGAPIAAGVAKPVDPANPGGNATPGSATKPGAPVATKRVAWTPKSGNVGSSARPHGARLESTLLFLAFPYIAVLVLILGLGVRYAMVRRRSDGPGHDASAASEARAAWQLFSGRGAWRTGLLVTVILHLLGLVIPRAILLWNAVPVRLYMLEASGFLLGALALVGWIQIMRRYLGRSAGTSRAGASEIADGILLSLLGLAMLSGLVIAVMYRWGSSWAVGTVTPYMQSLVRGAPATELVAQLPFLVRLHILSWFAMIAVVPFGSFALVLVALAHRGLLVIARPFEAGAQAGRRAAARLSPARWLWPEEDAIVDRLGDPDKAQGPS
jgi:nitrate reductase gamma subunit